MRIDFQNPHSRSLPSLERGDLFFRQVMSKPLRNGENSRLISDRDRLSITIDGSKRVHVFLPSNAAVKPERASSRAIGLNGLLCRYPFALMLAARLRYPLTRSELRLIGPPNLTTRNYFPTRQ
jgi:hypothetical protein